MISLANLCSSELRTLLARQRREYGISEDFPAQYPVEQEAANNDEAPVHNLDAEINFGKVDYRFKKIQSLEAVSRSLILLRAKDLREERETIAFRTFKKEAEAMREAELAWSLKMKDKMKLVYSEKQIIGQIKERKRLDMMAALNINGPFTDAGSVQNYLESVEVGDKEKQSRLKLELRFARGSSTNLLTRSLGHLGMRGRKHRTIRPNGLNYTLFILKQHIHIYRRRINQTYDQKGVL